MPISEILTKVAAQLAGIKNCALLFPDRVNLKPACLLLSLCYVSSVSALGLGELNVRSFLGQPLHATVNILGANATTAEDCFSLAPSEGGIAAPLRAQLSLEQAGNQTLLHIRTPYSVNDPIAQFALTSDCEGRLRRDYVVLLDPPAQITPASSQIAPAATVPLADPAPAIADTTPRTPQPVRRVNRAPALALASNLPTSASRRPAAPRAQTTAADSAPRLVLSGKRQIARATSTPVALQLDTNLPDFARPPSGNLTTTELSDENTALSRKLAYLEAQLTALQQRNAELELHRTAAPAVATPPVTGQPAQWPLYLLFMGLLIGAGILVVWLRRRNRQPAEYLQDVWQPSEAAVYDTAPAATDPLSQPLDMEPILQRMPEISRPTLIESTEIKDDILDQAEVYMAHGHGELAIHLLQEHLREAPAESPVPWLLLLDLLHRAGDAEAYAAAGGECRSYFNINLSGHPISQDNDIGLGLEAYPHLLEQLVNVWNSPDIDSFFHDLIYDNRGGTRVGFEPSAYRDILMLRAIAQDTLPLAA